jgi:hypothetical protein
MRVLSSETTIDAPPERVWAELMDFEAWPDWNPFLQVEGAAAVGSTLRVRLQPPGSRATTLRPKVVANQPQQRFAWLGHLGIRGIVDGRHTFEFEPAPGGTRFVQHEEFTGLAVFLLWPVLRKAEAGFVTMNASLKERSERPRRAS